MDLFDQPCEIIHETLGNDVEQWLIKSNDLYRSAEILYSAIGKPPDLNLGIIDIYKWFSLHNIARMLRGMALECLLKALWLAQGYLLVTSGNFVGIPETQSHDLYSMYLKACPKKSTLNIEEKKLLARLSYSIVSARYPISKSPKGNYPSAPTGCKKMQWNKCEYLQDEDIYKSLWKKINELISDIKIMA